MPLCCTLIFVGVPGPSLQWEETKNRSHPSSGTLKPPRPCGRGKVKNRGRRGGCSFFLLQGKLFISKGPSARAQMGQVLNCWHISLSAEGKVSRSQRLRRQQLDVVWSIELRLNFKVYFRPSKSHTQMKREIHYQTRWMGLQLRYWCLLSLMLWYATHAKSVFLSLFVFGGLVLASTWKWILQ